MNIGDRTYPARGGEVKKPRLALEPSGKTGSDKRSLGRVVMPQNKGVPKNGKE